MSYFRASSEPPTVTEFLEDYKYKAVGAFALDARVQHSETRRYAWVFNIHLPAYTANGGSVDEMVLRASSIDGLVDVMTQDANESGHPMTLIQPIGVY